MMTGFRKILATSIAVGALAMSGCGDDETNTTMASSDGGSSTGATTTVSTSLTAGTTTAGTTTAGTTTMGTTTMGTTTMGTTTDATGGSTDGTGTTGMDACPDVTIADLLGENIGVPIVGTGNIDIGDMMIPDVFRIEFYDDVTGVFDLSVAPEDNYATCNKCIRIFEDDDGMGGLARQYFQSAGTLEIDAATPPSGLEPLVTFAGVRLIEVTVDPNNNFTSTPVPNGQCIDIVDASVQATTPGEICGNGIDDNNNGLADCGDAACAADATCTGPCMAATAAALGINNGDTVGGGNAFQSSCNDFGGLENIWSFTPAADGLLTITLGSATDQGFSVRTNCADFGTEIECQDAFFGGTDEVGSVNVTNGVPVFIIVDGFAAGEEGPYTLDLDLQIAVAEVCDNGTDEDLDGLTDCDDPDCSAFAACTAVCTGGTAVVMGDNAGDTTGSTDLFSGTCHATGGLEDLWTFTAAANADLLVFLESATDQAIHIRTACTDQGTEVACRDAEGTNDDDEASITAVVAGTAYNIFVDGSGVGEEGPYTLHTVTPVFDAEAEANDDYLTANATANDGFTGSIVAGDEDWFSVTVGANGTINARTFGQVGICDGDSVVEVFDTDGVTMLGNNDDGGPGLCSNAEFTGLAAGTYFVMVRGFGAMTTFDYRLYIDVT